ncbi:MAG: PLP-dependent cysteine synthase family protein [Candidatus Promineifilaceae bacterium]|jgi:cysteine synthase B
MLLTVEQPRQTYFGFNPHSLEEQVGNTPLLRLVRTAKDYGLAPDVAVFAKAEWFNPGGSVKDRAALNIIRTAEEDGRLRPGMTILESTSGNTGIALAMLGTARGYRVKILAPENISPERKMILRAYGADLILTDPAEGVDGAMLQVRQLAAQDPNMFYANQYDNDANWQAHYLTTGNEIWRQTDGQITHFVAGTGTGGTFTGTTRRLKELNPQILCYAAQPTGPVNGIEGWKHMPTAIKPAIYDESLADGLLTANTEDAHAMARYLARHEGLFVGVSAAAAVFVAVKLARTLEQGVVATVLPDNGWKYMSESFWTEEE